MKKLLMTTAMVTVMGVVPALASDTGMWEDSTRTTTTTTTSQSEIDRVDERRTVTTIIASELDPMDIHRNHDWDGDGSVDHKHTVVTIHGMNFNELAELVGDQNNDGVIDYRDNLAYVGDTNNDGRINYQDYINRFGAQNIDIKQTYNYDEDYDGTRPYYAETQIEERSYQAGDYGYIETDPGAETGVRTERSDMSLWERFRSSFD